MDTVLSGLQWSNCLVYLDDIIILGKSFSHHLTNLQQVFDRLRQAGLRLQPAKCVLCKQSVTFLRHVISPEGIAADSAINLTKGAFTKGLVSCLPSL